MTLASPFTQTSFSLLLQRFQFRTNVYEFGGVPRLLEVVVFGHPEYDVQHIRHAATAAAALLEFTENLGWHNQLPWILIEELPDDLGDILVRDQIAVTDNHGRADYSGKRAKLTVICGIQKLIVNISYCRSLNPGATAGQLASASH
jgi:hypothetical protein